jgi:hypothetical protein
MKLFSLVAVLALIGSTAFADLIIDLRPSTSIAGAIVNGKDVSLPLDATGTINFDVWGEVTEAGGAIYGFAGQVLATPDKAAPNGVHGNMTNSVYEPAYIGSPATQTPNGKGDLVFGSDDIGQTFAGAVPSVATAAANTFVHLGSFQYDLTSAKAGSTAISFKTDFADAGSMGDYVQWASTASSFITPAMSPYTSTGPVTLIVAVPEPATLVLLGMGALALVFVRRRK